MRFFRAALGCVAIVASSASSHGVAIAAPESRCPQASVLTTRDGKTYAVVFTSTRTFSGTAHATLYTATHAYGASFPVTIGASTGDETFGSRPIALVDPVPDAIEAAEFIFDGAASGDECTDRERIAPMRKADPRVAAAFAGIDPAQPAIAFTRVIVDGTTTGTCAHPYEDARIDGRPAPLAYPAIARLANQAGIVVVRLALDASGRVTDAAVARSSGYPALDASAVSSASQTRYLPQVFRCRSVSGAYDFRANFDLGPG